MRLMCPLCRWIYWSCACFDTPLVEKETLGLRPVRALGWHEPPLSDLVHRLKYGEETFLADWFSAWLARGLADCKERVDLVPVPLHEKKLAERGYNQAALIARGTARRARTGLLIDGVIRTRETESQARLQAEERRTNLAGAFRVTRSLEGRRLVIVDDVVTTGSTSDALSEALEREGAKVLGILSITATPPKER